jgi:cardiolipin synthase
MLTKLPNLLTLARIALIPALVGAFYIDGPFSNWATLLIFVSAGITDYFDGYFARSLGQVSSLGRFLDPVADKLLVAAAILMLVALDRVTGITVLAAVVILCREILVSGLREFLAEIRVSLPVSNLAKWKTVLQMVAISFLLIGGAAPFNLPATEIGAYGLWIAALLTLYTGYDYLRAGLRYVRGADQAETSPKPTAPAKSTSQAG